MIDFSEIQRKITSKYSIDELEARLKPGDSKWKEDAWSDHSSGGFLAPTENLMDVVRADYDTLRILGKSYEEMANYASCFLKQVEKEGYHGKNALVEGISKLIAKHWKPLLKSTEFSTGLGPVAKNATSHGENSGSPKESGRAKRACHRSLTGGAAFLFDIDRSKFNPAQISSAGIQTCLWECKGKDEFGYDTVGSNYILVMERGKKNSDLMEKYLEIQMESSNREFPELEFNEAQNARRKFLRELEKERLGIEFGGLDRVLYLSAFIVVTDLTPHLIASHYFFEGDASYRTDPAKLLQVFRE